MDLMSRLDLEDIAEEIHEITRIELTTVEMVLETFDAIVAQMDDE